MAKKRVKKYKNPYRLIGILLITILVAFEAVLYTQPVASLKPTTLTVAAPATTAATMPWPAYGQSALGAVGFNYVASSGQPKPTPIASVAKMITALCVLKEKPLALGQQGPTITLGSADVDYYQNYVNNDGSVVPVQAGEQISEYQALQAMMLPSANNMADSLANWAFGSMSAYTSYANKYLASISASNSHMSDASGFSPQTLSSAVDLVKIGKLALADPVLAQIVAQKQAVVPVAGTVYNTNWLLGTDGIVGTKTGNTSQAGGCFLFAATRSVSGQNITVVGAVLNAPDLVTAMQDAHKIILASDANFQTVTAVHAGQIVASYYPKWQAKVNAVASQDVRVLVWRGQPVEISSNVSAIKTSSPAGSVVGKVSASADMQNTTSPLVLAQDIKQPPIKWRLFRL